MMRVYKNWKPKWLITFGLIALINTLAQSKTEFVRVVFNTNASYEATIIWNQLSGSFKGIWIDTIKPDGELDLQANQKNFIENHYKGMHNHICRLTGLKAKTKYYFALIDSDGMSNIYYFSTVSDQTEDKLAFIAGGDSRSLRDVRTKANKMVSKLKADAVVITNVKIIYQHASTIPAIDTK